MARFSLALALLAMAVSVACESSRHSNLYVDSGIEAELERISAIDNHAHPEKVVSDGEADRDYDALPADSIQDLALPTPFREGSPYFTEAWHGLFAYNYPDSKPEHLSELEVAKVKERKQRGDQYPSWILNRTNTDIMLANRVAMGRGLSAGSLQVGAVYGHVPFPSE